MPRIPDKEALFNKVPQDGNRIGNVTLQHELDWEDDKYWKVRNELIKDGRIAVGRGKGGSVYRISDVKRERSKKKTTSTPYKYEKDLYEPFKFVIEDKFTKERDIKNWVCENTGNQGRKSTGGTWTRPDVVMVTVNTYQYVPGKIMDIISFELKLQTGFGVTGVFETAAHTRFATKSYYCAYLPLGWDDESEEHDRIKSECERFGLGLIYFTDPKDWNTYEILVESRRRNPDPAEMDQFVANQLSETNKRKLSEFLH